MNNLSAPVNITNGPKGINLIDPFRIGRLQFFGQLRRWSSAGRSSTTTSCCWCCWP
jgi:hypothetical protein